MTFLFYGFVEYAYVYGYGFKCLRVLWIELLSKIIRAYRSSTIWRLITYITMNLSSIRLPLISLHVEQKLLPSS